MFCNLLAMPGKVSTTIIERSSDWMALTKRLRMATDWIFSKLYTFIILIAILFLKFFTLFILIVGFSF